MFLLSYFKLGRFMRASSPGLPMCWPEILLSRSLTPAVSRVSALLVVRSVSLMARLHRSCFSIRYILFYQTMNESASIALWWCMAKLTRVLEMATEKNACGHRAANNHMASDF